MPGYLTLNQYQTCRHHTADLNNVTALRWRHNGRDSVSNHQPRDCLLNRLFRLRSKKTPKPRVTGFCAGNSPRTGEFPAQMASYAENVSIWWRHHGFRQSRMENTESFVDVMNFSLNDKYDFDDVAKHKWINKQIRSFEIPLCLTATTTPNQRRHMWNITQYSRGNGLLMITEYNNYGTEEMGFITPISCDSFCVIVDVKYFFSGNQSLHVKGFLL